MPQLAIERGYVPWLVIEPTISGEQDDFQTNQAIPARAKYKIFINQKILNV